MYNFVTIFDFVEIFDFVIIYNFVPIFDFVTHENWAQWGICMSSFISMNRFILQTFIYPFNAVKS